MKSLEPAVAFQRNLLNSLDDVIAYKLGGTNKATRGIFGVKHPLLGGLASEQVGFGPELSCSGRCELELTAELALNGSDFSIRNWFLSLEFPDFSMEVEQGSAHSAIKNNLSARHLHILDVVNPRDSSVFDLLLNGESIEIINDITNLIAPPSVLVQMAMDLILEWELPYSSRLFNATGGLGSLFHASEGQYASWSVATK